MGAGLVRTNTNISYLALLNTKESLTVTTGPSSGHSESWYCPQSSHPARNQTGKVGGKHFCKTVSSLFQEKPSTRQNTYVERQMFIYIA